MNGNSFQIVLKFNGYNVVLTEGKDIFKLFDVYESTIYKYLLITVKLYK